MEIFAIIIFIIGYLIITLEHTVKINKTGPALLIGVLVWVLYFLAGNVNHESLTHHLSEISEILFFLLGAMTLVEVIDTHHGFDLVSKLIKTKNPAKLLIVVCIITFVLSALLDNLTTSIVMVTILRKLITDNQIRKYFLGMVIISANAGGAWSPIGDVTTTMLWIGGQITADSIILKLFVPSLISMVVPLLFSLMKVSQFKITSIKSNDSYSESQRREGRLMLIVGIMGLIGVPIFKTITHLPPYMGILLALGSVWIFAEIIHSSKDDETKKKYSVTHALTKIDSSSILFFLGILLAIAGLEAFGLLENLSKFLNNQISNQNLVVFIIGIASALIDNVPLVAASMGMYTLEQFPTNHSMWEFLAYCAGTGGSLLIIGSAAGVAVMGMEKIEFGWYLRKIGPIAFLGYIVGAISYLILN